MSLVYKLLLSLAVLGLVGIRLYYQRGYRRADVARAVRVVESRISVIVSALLLLPILMYVFTAWLSPLDFEIPLWTRWSGFGLSLISHLLLWWSHHALGANWQPDLAIRKDHQLVTDGPYLWVRHPMYLSFILLGLGMTLVAANWAITFFILPTPIVAYMRRSKQEEDMLEEAFGEVYRDYKSRTGSFLPKIKF
jgi:protein-S-isoprenylcysteine O-methyltransferase Ste14